MENSRAFQGIWIPKEIWLNKKLKVMEKIFLVEIESLDNEVGCFASNNYFSEFFNLSKPRCSEIISKLEEKGFITVNYIYKANSKEIEKRVIKCIKKTEYGSQKTEGGSQKAEGGYSEKLKDNNTIINNTINNKYIYSRIIDYLNKKATSNYKSTTKKTQGLILARMNEGFNEKDFIKVIDNKCNDWLGTDYEQYLRPETLFGTKFESYLNQKGKKGNKYGNGNANVRQDFNASENEYTGEVILPEKHYTDDEVSDI